MYKDMTATEYIRRRRRKLKEKGLCILCCKEARPGMTTCRACALKEAERAARRRKARIEAGLCARCGKRPPEKGKTNCGECLKHTRASFKAWYERRKEKQAWRQ